MWRFIIGLLLAVCWCFSATAQAGRVVHARFDQALSVYDVNPDLTYTRTDTIDTTLYTDRALRYLDRAADRFYPDKQSLEVVEAWVDQPDGSRIMVEKSSIFTRPAPSSQSEPGFDNSMTTTVLFPRLTHGSRTHIVWRFTQKTPPLLGFNVHDLATFAWDTGHDEIRINIPADVKLTFQARGGFAVEDHVEGGIRHLSSHIDNIVGREEEPAMTDHLDFMPFFMATSLSNQQEIGAIVHKAAAGRASVTPEIAALAAKIAGDKTGLDAARAIHAWIVGNIRYVAVYLNPEDGWLPHKADEILKAGYGDCKDYVELMRALLAARDVEGQMAVVDWGGRYADLPLPHPYFNHAILYLPAFDRFLNPTDRAARFDSWDRRLAGKQVVIMTPEGRVTRTPAATPEANRYRYAAQVKLDSEGTIDGDARYEMAPNMEIMIRGWLTSASSNTDLARRLLTATLEGGFGGFESSDPRDISQALTLSAHWHSPKAVNTQDREIYLRVPTGLDLYQPNSARGKLSADGARVTPVIADVTDEGWDTTITLPPGMGVARLPQDVDVQTDVGHYTAHYAAHEGTIAVSRNLVITAQIVPPESYAELERLIYAPVIDARAVIVLTPAIR